MNTQILYTKLAAVPPPIKIWLGSDAVVNIIDAIPSKYNLPEISSSIISKLIQRIEIKDIGSEYFMGELSSELNLDKIKILPVIEEIEKNIFIPIKNDLNKYGVDTSRFKEFNLPITTPAPKIMQDIGPQSAAMPNAAGPAPKPLSAISFSAPTPAPAPASSISASPLPGSPLPTSSSSTTKIPSPSDGKFAPFIPAKPQSSSSLSQAGWSKVNSSVISSTPTPSIASAPAPVPAPVITPKAPMPTPVSAMPVSPAMPIAPAAPTTRAMPAITTVAATPIIKPAPSSEPAPVMLHQDAKFAAGEKSADFHLTRPGGGAEVSLEGVSSQQKAKPAMLELGALANTPGQASPSKLVHYSQFQAGATPQAASGTPASRNVTEITSAPAKPTPMNVGPTTSITPPKINPLSPKPSISAAIPIPQPPKPSSGMSQSPSGTPQPPKPPVVQKNYP